MTNRLISEKIASWDFVPPFDFAAQFRASRAVRRGEQTSLSAPKNLTFPVWWTILKSARTFFERNGCGVSQSQTARAAREGKGDGGKGIPAPPSLPEKILRRIKGDNFHFGLLQ